MGNFYASYFYKALPYFIQNNFITIRGFFFTQFRRGMHYISLSQNIKEFETYSSDQIEAFQLASLKKLVNHAYVNVTYYAKKFNEIGFNPNDFKSLKDLNQLPLLEKTTVIENYNDLIANNFRKKMFLTEASTSGTTGGKLTIKRDDNNVRSEYAFFRRQHRWAGVPPNARIAIIRGDLIVPVQRNKAPFWRYDAFNREMFFSAYHISEKNIHHYIHQLHKFDPHLIYSYPSSLFAIAQFAESINEKLSMPSLRCLITSSETLLDYQKQKIQDAFHASIFDFYGQAERSVCIGTCEQGAYHIFPDYGVAELLPLTKENENGTQCEIVGTNLSNYVMPLIRYRTGDIVEPDENGHCGCGRKFPCIKSIDGRIYDDIVTPEGNRVSMIACTMKLVENIRFSQIIQQSKDEISIKVVPNPSYSQENTNQLIALFRERLGATIRIDVTLVDNIPLSKSGKFKLVISDADKKK